MAKLAIDHSNFVATIIFAVVKTKMVNLMIVIRFARLIFLHPRKTRDWHLNCLKQKEMRVYNLSNRSKKIVHHLHFLLVHC